MLTFKEVTEKPRLEIAYDRLTESPREWDNLGKFIAISNRLICPDDDKNFISIVKDSADYATSQEEHIELIKKGVEELGDKVVYTTPISRYEHGRVSYSVGNGSGFDVSNNGFYIVTEQTLKNIGLDKKTDEEFDKLISSELELFNKWANNEVFGFTLYDENGEEVDSCGGFYDLDSIKEHLPEEFENERMEDYLKL